MTERTENCMFAVVWRSRRRVGLFFFRLLLDEELVVDRQEIFYDLRAGASSVFISISHGFALPTSELPLRLSAA
jgi:hypothetical protein